MKSSDSFSPSEAEAIEATAAAWLAQRDDGLSAAQLAQFAQWHEADPRHAAALARLEATWALLGQLREYRPEARVHPDRDLLAKPRPVLVLYKPFVVTAAIAATLTLVAVGWWSFTQPAAPRAEAPQYATTSGGYQRMTLEDGSVVELNADSEVRVNYTPDERRVQLVKGEAHFTVAKNQARPFWVEAGAITVRAVGTAFNVRLGRTQIEVLVTEGKVEVAQPAAHSANVTPVAPALLLAGQRLVVAPASLMANLVVEKIVPSAMNNALGWQDSRLYFNDTPLVEVVEQFNTHNQVQIELADATLAEVPIGGSWRAKNVEAFVRMLAANPEIAIERPTTDRIILRRAP